MKDYISFYGIYRVKIFFNLLFILVLLKKKLSGWKKDLNIYFIFLLC